MSVRKLIAVGVVGLSVIGLSACQSNVGVAATVQGHRITESRVHSFVSSSGPTAAALAQAAQAGQPLPTAKVLALNFLVQEQVFQAALQGGPGGLPSDAALRALHDTAAQTLLQTQDTGATVDAEIVKAFEGDGLTSKALPVVVRTIELEFALITRIKATALAQLAKAVTDLHIKVSVNPAYGQWDPTQVGVEGTTSTPSFLKLETPSGATPAVSASPAG